MAPTYLDTGCRMQDAQLARRIQNVVSGDLLTPFFLTLNLRSGRGDGNGHGARR